MLYRQRVSKLFISHAGADRELVEPFVTTILQLGCGLDESDIFFSSRRATGVPAGADLSHYVRERAEEADLVVAIISLNFQASHYCIAELGAAWGITGKLHPILTPGTQRTDLDGVLPTLLIQYLDEGEALDELHGRVCDALGIPQKAATWNQRKAEWLASVSSYAAKLPMPFVVGEAEYKKTMAELDGSQAALTASLEEQRRLQEVVERLKAAKDADEVAEVLAPEDDIEAFEELRAAAAEALSALPSIAVEAIRYTIEQGSMPPARPFYDQDRNDIDDALTEGWLVRHEEGDLTPNKDLVVVETAVERVQQLHELMGSPSKDFRAWFRTTYGISPDLEKKLVWDKVFP